MRKYANVKSHLRNDCFSSCLLQFTVIIFLQPSDNILHPDAINKLFHIYFKYYTSGDVGANNIPPTGGDGGRSHLPARLSPPASLPERPRRQVFKVRGEQ
jgi:hypothetical protein